MKRDIKDLSNLPKFGRCFCFSLIMKIMKRERKEFSGLNEFSAYFPNF